MTDLPPGIDAKTLDFIYEHTKGVAARQGTTAHQHDTKALQVFAAASVVVGLAAAGTLRADAAAAWVYGAALVAYGFAATAASFVLWVRKFRVTDDADEIWEKYQNVPLGDTKHALVDDIATAYTENAGRLKWKTRGLKVLVGAAALETLLVGVAVLLSLA